MPLETFKQPLLETFAEAFTETHTPTAVKKYLEKDDHSAQA